MTAVKICGVTRSEDALAAAHCGAQAIGLVFYRPSPRYIEPDAAAAIVIEILRRNPFGMRTQSFQEVVVGARGSLAKRIPENCHRISG